MNEAEAFSPGHVTGLFSIHEDADPRRKGSLGAGFCVALGVSSRVAESERELYIFDGQLQADVPVSRAVVRLFFEHTGLPRQPLLVTQTSALPVGCGFGTSGAGALSLVLALNALCGAPLAREEAAALAHLAELEIGTGLGTVIGELSGGMEIRAAAGAPGTGRVIPVPFQESWRAVFLVFGPLSTAGLLKQPALRSRINSAGLVLLDEFKANPTPDCYLALASEFTRRTGLLTPLLEPVVQTLESAGFTPAMLMFGEGVYTLVPEELVSQVTSLLARFQKGAHLLVTPIDPQGGRVIHVL
ncbi:MAG: GHMP kinase [Spirochaetales bacterium]|nr:GHMP kinase [Spirochaetales bacterium]